MKTTRLLRILTLLGFLLLMAPFYDACDGYGMRTIDANAVATTDSTAVEVDNVAIDTTEINKIEIDTISNSVETKKDPFYMKIYDYFVVGGLNGFVISCFSIDRIHNTTYEEFKIEFTKSSLEKDWYKNLVFFISFLFDVIILISFSIFLLSFTKRTKTLNKLALVNSILVIITLLYIIFLESSFEHFRQIKWGYYAFIITNSLIFYFSKKAIKNISK